MSEEGGEIYWRFSDLAQFGVDDVFAPRPTTLVIVATLEIVIKDDFGTSLLVISPRYEEVEVVDNELRTPLPESGHWTVPYISRSLESPSGGYKHIKATLAEVDKALKTWDPEPKLKVYADTIFRGVNDIERIGGFYELKQSWSQPQVTKLYRIVRCRPDLANCEAGTLADANSRKGIAYLPIDSRYEEVTRVRYCPLHRREERLYQSQPIETNLCALVDHTEDRRGLKSQAIKLNRNAFFRKYTGLLLCGDIAGYGAASSYAEDHMTDFSKRDHGAVLRDSATVAFTGLFLHTGVSQVHIAGDGFICAIPLATSLGACTPDMARNALQYFADAYMKYVASLEHLSRELERHVESNAGVAPSSLVLGSRLAIHYGEYRYGKMTQAASLLTGFDGREIVAVTRLEEGLSIVRNTPKLARAHAITGVAHVAAASKDALRAVGGARGLPESLQYMGTFKAMSKDFQRTAALLRVNQPPRAA